MTENVNPPVVVGSETVYQVGPSCICSVGMPRADRLTSPVRLQLDIARVAALLHRAAGLRSRPTMKETKYLLPKAALLVRDIKPPQWVNMVQDRWTEVQDKTPSEAKRAVLGE